jgi:hypothetical protein
MTRTAGVCGTAENGGSHAEVLIKKMEAARSYVTVVPT